MCAKRHTVAAVSLRNITRIKPDGEGSRSTISVKTGEESTPSLRLRV
jgi:hypothetical protein